MTCPHVCCFHQEMLSAAEAVLVRGSSRPASSVADQSLFLSSSDSAMRWFLMASDMVTEASHFPPSPFKPREYPPPPSPLISHGVTVREEERDVECSTVGSREAVAAAACDDGDISAVDTPASGDGTASQDEAPRIAFCSPPKAIFTPTVEVYTYTHTPSLLLLQFLLLPL